MNTKIMKKLTLILLLISTFANAQVELAEDYSFKKDKKLHTGMGVAISTGVFFLVNNKTNDENIAFNAAWMTAATASLVNEGFGMIEGKEISIADIGYTTISAVSWTFILRAITKYRNKKRAKRNKKLRAALNI